MLSKVRAAALSGIQAVPVEVEVNNGPGETGTVIVGLPDAAVRESRDRVGTAITNSGYRFALGWTTINLAPADIKKEGPSFDLPIAIGMLAASGQIESDSLKDYVFIGELALSGAVRHVKGALSVALAALDNGQKGLIVPVDSAPEAAVVKGLKVIPIHNLREAAAFLEGELNIKPLTVDTQKKFENALDDELDMADVKGQDGVKRALEIAAAGGHNVMD